MAVPDEVASPAPNIAIADPAPLGLAGFALTTFLISVVNAGWLPLAGGSIWLGMAMFYGGAAQFCAGMWSFRRGATFPAVAFSSYGAFWMGLAIIFFVTPVTTMALGKAPNDALAWFFFAWGVFTLYMTVAALRTNVAVLGVFVFLTLTYLFLWLGAWQNNGNLTNIGGYLGIVTAAVAWYAAMAGVVNATWGRIVFPEFPLT
ncbi:MAG: acetate uptake transporter [Chloroflexota bacterium]